MGKRHDTVSVPFYVCRATKTPEEMIAASVCDRPIYEWLVGIPADQRTFGAKQWLQERHDRAQESITREIAQCEAGRYARSANDEPPDEGTVRIVLKTRGPAGAARSDAVRSQSTALVEVNFRPDACPLASWRLHCDVDPEVTLFAPDAVIDGVVNFRFVNSRFEGWDNYRLYGNAPSSGVVLVPKFIPGFSSAFTAPLLTLAQTRPLAVEALVEVVARAAARYPRPPEIPGEAIPPAVPLNFEDDEVWAAFPLGVEYIHPGGILSHQGPLYAGALLKGRGGRLAAEVPMYSATDPFGGMSHEQVLTLSVQPGRHGVRIRVLGRPSFVRRLRDPESGETHDLVITNTVTWTPGTPATGSFPEVSWFWDVVDVGGRSGTPILTLDGMSYFPALDCAYLYLSINDHLPVDLAIVGLGNPRNAGSGCAVVPAGTGQITLVWRLAIAGSNLLGSGKSFDWEAGPTGRAHGEVGNALLLRPGTAVPDADGIFFGEYFSIGDGRLFPAGASYTNRGELLNEDEGGVEVSPRFPAYDADGRIDYPFGIYGGDCPVVEVAPPGYAFAAFRNYLVSVIEPSDPRFGTSFEARGTISPDKFAALFGTMHVVRDEYVVRCAAYPATERSGYLLVETSAVTQGDLAAAIDDHMSSLYPPDVYAVSATSMAYMSPWMFRARHRAVAGLLIEDGILCEVIH